MINDFDKITKPSYDEVVFYEKNNIPLWQCELRGTHDFGLIYKDEYGSSITAKVECLPAQFWTFGVYCAESKKKYHIETGSGVLSTYFDIMKLIADGMLDIDVK